MGKGGGSTVEGRVDSLAGEGKYTRGPGSALQGVYPNIGGISRP